MRENEDGKTVAAMDILVIYFFIYFHWFRKERSKT